MVGLHNYFNMTLLISFIKHYIWFKLPIKFNVYHYSDHLNFFYNS